MLAPIFGSWDVRVCEAQEMKKEVGNIMKYFLKTLFWRKIWKSFLKTNVFEEKNKKFAFIRSLGNYSEMMNF